MKSKVTGTDNVFEDLGFDPAEAANLKIRSELMLEIKQYIKINKLTQLKAAKIMGVDQPRVSKLLKGQIELFTIDVLIQMLERAGIHMVLMRAA
jgi:predicted XRE-type DNA-binding protein